MHRFLVPFAALPPSLMLPVYPAFVPEGLAAG